MFDFLLLLVFDLFITGSYPGAHNRIPVTQQNSIRPWYPSAPSRLCVSLNFGHHVSFAFIYCEFAAAVDYVESLSLIPFPRLGVHIPISGHDQMMAIVGDLRSA